MVPQKGEQRSARRSTRCIIVYYRERSIEPRSMRDRAMSDILLNPA
jgi:hypothetical protein